MSSARKRLLAAALCAVMALGLFVPAGAAPAMFGDSQTVAETPVGETALAETAVQAATGVVEQSATAERPAVSGQDGQASLLADSCTCSATNPHLTGSSATFTPGEDVVHYLDYTKGTTFTLNINTTGTLSSADKGTGLSNNGGLDKDAKTYAVKTDSKAAAGLSSFLSFKIDGTKYTVTIELVDPNACVHEWDDGEVTTPATCGEDGEKTYTCTKCGATKTETIPATGDHAWSETQYETITEPTCTATGLEGKVCTVCGAVSDTETNTLAALGHTYKDGESGGICQVCGWDSEQNAYHTHTWQETDRTDATCQATGSVKYVCSTEGCGATKTDTLAKIPHSFGGDGKCIMCDQTQEEVAGNMADQGGWLESAYIEWPIQSGVARYEVYVKEATAAAYPDTPIDDQLIRRYPGDLMRADALGLKAGSYKMKVVAYDSDGNELTDMDLESGTLEVQAHTREGYAFWSGSTYGTASGAYNDDGTLKDNAIVLYVTNDNFNTVQATVTDSKGKQVTFTGVQAIVDSSGVAKSAPGTPICIRVLGTIDTTGFPKSAWGSSAEGLQVKGSSSYENKNLTIEGVGNDATLNGFGVLIRNCGNVEVRNLGIINFADDGISVDTNNCNLWIHNLDLFYGGPGSDSDQAKGDGSIDMKKSKYCTVSFNHFWDSGKSCLLDASAGSGSDYMTYHHNWFDHSDSRHPRVRNSTHTHVYNNYYDGNAKFGIGATTGCDIFAENNYFRSCKDPMLTSLQGTDAAGDGTFSGNPSGFIKAYGNKMTGTYTFVPYTSGCGTNYDAYVTETRDTTIPDSVTGYSGNTYNNFDTNSSEFYTDGYAVQTADDAVNTVTAYAGRVQGGDLKWTFDSSEDTNYAIISELKFAVTGYTSTLDSVGGTVDGTATGGTISVSKVTLNTTSAVLKPGDTAQLTATVVPSTATDKAVSWSSSNAAVATVDDDGLVTAVANGTATITVTTDDGDKTATCAVTVSDDSGESGGESGGEITTTTTTYTLNYKDYKMGSDISSDGKKSVLTQDELDEKTGGYFTLTPAGTDGIYKRNGNGNSSNPSSLIGTEAEFIELPMSDTVGISFTVKNGPATVKVTWTNPKSGQTSTMELLNATTETAVADSTGATNPTSSEKKEVTTIYTLEAGTYMLHAPSTSEHTVRLFTLIVTEPNDEEGSGGTTTPEVDKSALTTAIAEAEAALGLPAVSEDGSDVDPANKWVSQADKDLFAAAINQAKAAELTAASAEEVEAAVTALQTAQAAFAEAQSAGSQGVAVKVTGVTLSKTAATITVGDAITLTATVQPTDATNKGVYWTSSDTSVLTVTQEGKITGVAKGTATVTVKTDEGGFTAACAVTVNASSGGSSSSGSSGGSSGGTTTGTTSTGLPFVDVAATDWFVDSVKQVYAQGLMKGVDDTHFDPNANTSRAMVVTVLFRLAGEQKVDVSAAFSDVVSGAWYADAVEWATQQGVVEGYGNGIFAPDENVTREQLAVMLYRYAGVKTAAGVDLSATFTDAADVSDWAAEAIAWAVDKGIMNGKGDGILDPGGVATRAEICTMLVRFTALDA